MSFNFIPAEQFAAQVVAGLLISEGQNGDGAKITARAQSALKIGAVLTDLGNGSASTAIADLNTALQNPAIDPAVADGIQKMVQLGLTQVQIAQSVDILQPIFGAVPEAVLKNVGAGVTGAANLEIAKYASAAK